MIENEKGRLGNEQVDNKTERNGRKSKGKRKMKGERKTEQNKIKE